MTIAKTLARTWLTLIFLLLTAAFLAASTSLSPVAGVIPRAVSLLTLILLLVHFTRLLSIPKGQPHKASFDGRTSLVVILWISVLPLAVTAVGVVAGSTLFCLFFLKGYAKESWMTSLLYSLALGACLYLFSLLIV